MHIIIVKINKFKQKSIKKTKFKQKSRKKYKKAKKMLTLLIWFDILLVQLDKRAQ